MTTTDTDALKKRFARTLYVSWWTDHMQDPSAPYDHPLNEDAREACESAAEALLPTVAEEVRKAKAEALREMQEHHEREADKAQTIAARGIHLTIADGARKRATKYETGDSDGHR